jgi:hypothetical protein
VSAEFNSFAAVRAAVVDEFLVLLDGHVGCLRVWWMKAGWDRKDEGCRS